VGVDTRRLHDFIANAVKLNGKANASALLEQLKPHGVFVTQGFERTLADKEAGALVPNPAALNDYLRPVSMVLVFAGGELLLLSDQEGKTLVRWYDDLVCGRGGVTVTLAADITASSRLASFVHLRLFVLSADHGTPGTVTAAGTCAMVRRPSRIADESDDEFLLRVLPEVVVAVELFAGGVKFQASRAKEALCKVVSSERCALAAMEMVAMRGQSHTLRKSDLAERLLESLRIDSFRA
jgi:hypothetical protein